MKNNMFWVNTIRGEIAPRENWKLFGNSFRYLLSCEMVKTTERFRENEMLNPPKWSNWYVRVMLDSVCQV